MSVRKNVIIAISIVVLCMLLLTQLLGNPAPLPSSGSVKVDTSNVNSDSSTDVSEETVHLSAVVYLTPLQFKELFERNEQFMKEQSNIRVELTNIDSRQAYSYFKERAVSGNSPDIMLLDYMWVNEFAASGYLSHQLEKHIQAIRSEADEMIVWNGYTWAVPGEYDPYVVILNEQAFQTEWNSSIPRTTDEWTTYRKARIAAGLREGAVFIDPEDPFAFISLIWALGGNWSIADNGMYELSPDSVELIELLFGSESEDGETGALLYTAPLSVEEKWTRFDDDLLSVVIMRLSDFRREKPQTGNYLYTMVPAMEETQGLWLSGTGYAVSSGSSHPAESFQWINAMSVANGSNNSTGTVGRTFASDPEINRKIEIVRSQMKALYDHSVQPEEWNSRFSSLWSSK